MSAMRRVTTTLGATFAGCLGGVVVSVWFGGHRPAEGPAPVPRVETQSPAPGTTTIVLQSGGGAEPANTVRPEQVAAVLPKASPSPADGRPDDTREKLREKLTVHDAEPRSRWGVEATKQFTQELADIGHSRAFEVEDVDCRTVTCAARVKFENGGAAHTGWLAIAAGQYTNNCERQVVIDEADMAAPESQQHAAVFFDCTSVAQ